MTETHPENSQRAEIQIQRRKTLSFRGKSDKLMESVQVQVRGSGQKSSGCASRDTDKQQCSLAGHIRDAPGVGSEMTSFER